MTKLVRSTLSKQPCIDFYNTVLNAASTRKNPVLEGGNLANIFEDFLNQPKNHPLISDTMPKGSEGYGNPLGNIKKSTAAIFSANKSTEGLAHTIISELFHLAGEKDTYSDQQLANALHDSKYAADAGLYIEPSINIFDPRYEPIPSRVNRKALAYSDYFHTIQANLCNVSNSPHWMVRGLLP